MVFDGAASAQTFPGKSPVGVAEGEDAAGAKTDWQTQKAEQARIRKLENGLKKAEERIAWLEDQIAKIDWDCAQPENATNSAKLNELAAKQEAHRMELAECYETWETLSLELEDETIGC